MAPEHPREEALAPIRADGGAIAPVRVVVLADSLALPRIYQDQVVRWEETWPYLLERRLVALGQHAEVINCGARARTAEKLLAGEFTEHVVFKRPNVVITQVGITDCSPRIFSRFEKRVLNLPRFPPQLRDWVIRHRSKRRAAITRRDPLSKVYNLPEAFERAIANFCDAVSQLDWRVALVFLPILSDPHRMEQKSPGHTGNVRLYNDVLSRLAAAHGALYVRPEQLFFGADPTTAFFRDGYHLTPAGNQILSSRLAPLLSHFVGQSTTIDL